MIDAITGRIVRLGEDHIVIETAGIAYRVFCPASAIHTYHLGEEGLIYTHLVVRDDALSLFGFPSLEEREIFRRLLPVGQVGPRLALQIISLFSPDEFILAVSAGDVDKLTQVKGIGRKTAQRILVELRDKLTPDLGTGAAIPLSQKEETALRALTGKSLGFSVSEARRALERLRSEDLPLAELVKRALEVINSS
ncbi:MAG TPA: Holliday junction branch migration protein RuvA [Candidatus Acetothermia bacterium]|nr:Holliday junction branch migration protein RuvA [Candidatus Acetothermia bacterium]